MDPIYNDPISNFARFLAENGGTLGHRRKLEGEELEQFLSLTASPDEVRARIRAEVASGSTK